MTIKAIKNLKSIHKKIIFLDFLFGASRGIIIPFLMIDMTNRLGVDITSISSVIFIYFIFRTIGGPLGGYFSDCFGRKIVLLIGTFTTSALYILLAFVTTLSQFFIVFILLGFFHAMFRTSFMAIIGDNIDKKDDSIPFALFYIVQNLSFGVGTVMGGLIISFNASLLYILTGILLAIISAVSIIFLFNPLDTKSDEVNSKKEEKNSFFNINLKSAIYSIFLLNIITVCSYGVFNELLGIIFNKYLNMDPVIIGIVFVINPIIIVLLQLYILQLIKNWDFYWQIIFSLSVFSIFFLTISLFQFFDYFILAFISIFIFTLGELTHVAKLNTKINEFTSTSNRGKVFGMLSATWNIGFGLGPLFFSFLMKNYNLFIAGISFFLINILVVLVLIILKRYTIMA